VEEGVESVKFALADGVVFVIVTSCANHRQSEPDCGCCVDTVYDVFDQSALRHSPFQS
jgi:hypothetical protein